MATLTQIEIDGFKAFPKNFKLDLGTGKNLLLYGENGSGKSSLYYALHALLQSVFKDDKGAKYFKPGDINGEEFIVNDEHLINIFRTRSKGMWHPHCDVRSNLNSSVCCIRAISFVERNQTHLICCCIARRIRYNTMRSG